MHHHQSSTDENYHEVWKLFNEFFIQLNHKPPTWEDRLALFATYPIKQRKQSQTDNSYLPQLNQF